MVDVVSTLCNVIFFGRNKGAEKMLHENKNSTERLTSTAYVIKYSVKVGKFGAV